MVRPFRDIKEEKQEINVGKVKLEKQSYFSAIYD